MASPSEGKGKPTTSTAAPTFLDYDPYASNEPDDRPNSSYSATTDGMSGMSGVKEAINTIGTQDHTLTSTGPVGEPGLPPSRPMNSNNASQANRRSLPPGSRNSKIGIGGFANGNGVDSTGDGMADSRPTSNTHVPSIAQQNFFRPMSGQRLQAQRDQATRNSVGQSAIGQSAPSVASTDQHTVRSRRYSNASLNTVREGRPTTQDGEANPVPTSRGTMSSGGEFMSTDPSLKTYGSTTPLHSRLDPLDTRTSEGNQQAAVPASDKTPRTPLSFRTSFGLGSKTTRPEPERREMSQHEKLDSQPPSLQNGEKDLAAAWSESPKYAGKNYEYWAGNILFLGGGRLMNTKAWPLNVATFLLMVLPSALFFGFSAPFLWHHVSPAIPIIFAYFLFVTLSSFLHAALSDPGTLPRNLHPHPSNPEEEDNALAVPPTTEWIMVKTFPSDQRSPLPGRGEADDAAENGNFPGATAAMEVPTKYCKTCNIWRPPRTHHCRVCDACIETQDHHCVWLNNCVGRRNYRFFFTYVAFASLTTFLLIAFSVTHVARYGDQHGISFRAALTGRTQERVGFAVFIYGLLAAPYPAALLVYHVWLITRGETTREYLNGHKFQLKDRHRPFTQSSFMRNFVSIVLRPRNPSYLQFKHKHEEGDIRFGYDARKKDRRRDLRKRYSVQGGPGGNGNGNGESNGNGNGGGLEMKKLSATSTPKKPVAKSAGGLSGMRDSTPRG